MSTPEGAEPRSESYWYEADDPAVPLLRAVRDFQQADAHMRRHMGDDLDLNATDLQALRHAIAHAENGRPLTARDLTAHLDISTASTSKLLNRLSGSGHIRRVPHPEDRRSVYVEPTEHAHREVRGWLAPMHQRMIEAARAVPAEHRQEVIDFLTALTEAFEEPPED